jgi:type II secretory pathway pseudopilin PulG
MIKRLRDEGGFGLLELLIAMVVLNVGLFALVGAFNAATVGIARAGTISAASAVADKQMEIYRSLADCAIYLDAGSATASFPAAGSGSLYQADASAYSNGGTISYLDKSTSTAAKSLQPWATLNTSQVANTAWNFDIPTSCVPSASTPPATATQATQTLPGPDGSSYTVYTYITIVQPTGGTWEKRVTIVVRDYTNQTKILARQSSDFAPSESDGLIG